MKQILAALALVFVASLAHAQYLLRTSPVYSGGTNKLVLAVSQFDQYNVTLNANTPIQFSVPVVSGAVFFRVNVCENALGGFTPSFTAISQSGVGAPTVVAYVSTVISTAANSCSIEYWTYRQNENKLVLENATPTGPFPYPGPVQNPISYGAVASTVTVSCSGLGSSQQVTCTGTGDFQPGQNIDLRHAGATETAAAPTGITITSSKWNTAVNADTADGAANNAACYQLVTLDGLGGRSAPTAITCITNSQNPTGFSLFNKIAWSSTGFPTEVFGCIVGNPATSCTPTTTPMAIVPANQTFYYDAGPGTGIRFGTDADGSAALSGPLNDDLYTTVNSVSNGNPTILTAPLVNSVTSQTLFHDNSVPINSADTAACANGGEVYLPQGTYPIGQTVQFLNCAGTSFRGVGGSIAQGSVMLWYGPLGGTAVLHKCIRDSHFGPFTIDDTGGNTPAYGLQSSNAACTLTNNTNNWYNGVTIGESGYGVYISDTAVGNNSPLYFNQLKFFNGGIANITINNGQSKNNQWFGNDEARRFYGVYCITCGDQAFFGSQGDGWIEEWAGNTTTLTWFGGDDEQSSRYAVTAGPTGAAGIIAFYGSVLQVNPSTLPTDGKILSDSLNSPLILDGVNFLGGGGLPQSTVGIYTNRSANNGVPSVISRGNAYTNITPFQYVSTANSVISQGDTGSTGASNVALPTLAGLQSYYNAASNAIPACSALYAGASYCVSDETSACTQSNTYASGGTNKCQVQCNSIGTLWKVTGGLCF